MTSVRYKVLLPPGDTFRMVPQERIRREERLASLFNCRSVGISPDPVYGRRGTITVHYGPSKAEIDWLADVGPWPWLEAGVLDISRPIPIGKDERGHLVCVTMLYNNLLIGGIPGAGKSVAMGMVMATGALDPTVELWTIDGGGGVEMKVWRHRAARQAITEQDAFLLLQALKAEVDRRLAELMESDRQKIEPGEPTILLGIEELATYTAKDKKRDVLTGYTVQPKDPGETFEEALTYIVRLGRKVGVMAAANTQRPSATVVDPNLRDLLGTGLALYCKTGTSSDTILGEGWRGQGYNAAKLPKNRKGSFILSPESDTPTRGRCFFVDGDELRKIAARSVEPSVEPPSDDDDAQLCLENGENIVEPWPETPLSYPGLSDSAPVEPSSIVDVEPSRIRLSEKDRQALAAALDPITGPELDAIWGGSYGRKRRKALTDAGYLSSPHNDFGTPRTYLTTLTGREQIKREEAQ